MVSGVIIIVIVIIGMGEGSAVQIGKKQPAKWVEKYGAKRGRFPRSPCSGPCPTAPLAGTRARPQHSDWLQAT